MMFEATVFLAYYKDIMFAMITLLNYIGIYMNLRERHDLDYFKKVVISFMSIISVFIAVTFLHDFDKVFYRQYSKFYGKYQQNRIIMLNTPKKKNQKKSNFELQHQKGGRSQSFVVWQQFYDLQNKPQEDEELEDDRALEDRFELADEEDTQIGAEWYEDTEIDRGEYENMVVDADGEIYQELDGKRPIKGSF